MAIIVGIDVGKHELEVAVRPGGEHWQVRNDPTGIAALLERIRGRAIHLVVLEATGGYERAVAAALAAAQVPAGA